MTTAEKAAHRPVRQGVTVGGEFVDLTDQLATVDEATKLEGMEPQAAVALSAVPRERVVGSHWLAPSGPGSDKALKLLATELREARRGLAVTWTKRTNQALGVLVPYRVAKTTALLLLELEWADHWREPEDRVLAPVAQVETTAAEHEAARRFIDAYAAPMSTIDELRDTRLAARVRLLEAARAGEHDAFEPPAREVPSGAGALAEVVDLAAAR